MKIKDNYLITVGSQKDKGLFVWKIEDSGIVLLSQNKITKPILQLEFSNSCMITVGPSHIKYWKYDF